MRHLVAWVTSPTNALRPAAKVALMLTALCLVALSTTAPAGAHVQVDAESTIRGSTTNVVFQVPNESKTGSPTTEIMVTLPAQATTHTHVLPGWLATLERDVSAGTVKSVTWRAADGGGIPPDQFEMFRLKITLPDAETVAFPTKQTYADGTVVSWDQISTPGTQEPEHPAPVLRLTHGQPPQGGSHGSVTEAPRATTPAPPLPGAPAQSRQMQPDNIARALAGGALLLAALGVGIALVRRGA